MTRKEKIVSGILKNVARSFVDHEETIVQAILDSNLDLEDVDESVVEAALVQLEKNLNPMSRGDKLWKFDHSGATKARRTCRLCGRSATWCAKWPRTVGSIEIENRDTDSHLTRVLEVAAQRRGKT